MSVRSARPRWATLILVALVTLLMLISILMFAAKAGSVLGTEGVFLR